MVVRGKNWSWKLFFKKNINFFLVLEIFLFYSKILFLSEKCSIFSTSFHFHKLFFPVMSWYKTFFPYIKRSLFLSRQRVLATCYPIKLQEEFFPCPKKRKLFARWCKLRMQLLELRHLLLRDLLLHKITVLKYIF